MQVKEKNKGKLVSIFLPFLPLFALFSLGRKIGHSKIKGLIGRKQFLPEGGVGENYLNLKYIPLLVGVL